MKYFISLSICLLLFLKANAQSTSDTLFLKDGTILLGKVKSMERGDLVMEVLFTENIIKVKWSLISKMNSNKKFLLATNEGDHFESRILSFQDDR